MASCGPNLLVVADDAAECALISETLAEAGFGIVAAADATSATIALRRQPVAAAVCAQREDQCAELLPAMRRQEPDLPVLCVLDPAEADIAGDKAAVLVRRPLDPGAVLAAVYELMTGETAVSASDDDAAERGIAAAQLACLDNRRIAAAASGASRLAGDLAREIGRRRAAAVRGLEPEARAA